MNFEAGMARVCTETVYEEGSTQPAETAPIDPWLRDPRAIAEAERIVRLYVAWRLPRHEAEDLVQDVFARFYSRPSQAGPIRNIAAFLRRTARNLLIDRYRVPAFVEHVSDEVLNAIPDEGASPDTIVFTRQALAEIEKTLLSLPTLTQDIFYMHRFEGMTCREIASVCQVPRSTVHDHLARALQAMVRSALPYIEGLKQ